MVTVERIYDVIVAGAGVEGSATAYSLAKQGKDVVLLEQFPLPHNRGSSHGQSRITRMVYEDDFYTEMMKEANALMDELQAQSGQNLYRKCGCLVIGPCGKAVENSKSALIRHGVQHEVFGAEEMRRMHPGVEYPSDYEFVLDKTGGILMADKVLKAFQSEFVRYGGQLRDGEPVTAVTPGTVISVQTSKHAYKCSNLVLALGPWAAKFLPRLGLELPLQPVKVSVCYWKEKVPGQFSPTSFPCFLQYDKVKGQTFVIYGLPAQEYPGLVKVCLHNGSSIDPDQRDKGDNLWVLNEIREYIVANFPGLESTPSVVETCIYTNTPDHHPILDVHPKWKNIVIAAGFSGHGFKLAPVVGKILAQLATGIKPQYDMKPFKLDRFFKHKL